MDAFSAALTSAATAAKLALGFLDAKEDAKVRGALIDMQSRLLDAMSAALDQAEKLAALQQELGAAKSDLAAARAKLEDRGRYPIHEYVPGVFVRKSQPSVDDPQEPEHLLCAACFDLGTKSVLVNKPADQYLRCLNDATHSVQVRQLPQFSGSAIAGLSAMRRTTR